MSNALAKRCLPIIPSKSLHMEPFTKKPQNFRHIQIESIAEDKINMALKLKLVLERIENKVAKGENAS